jgi:hypothetical protein
MRWAESSSGAARGDNFPTPSSLLLLVMPGRSAGHPRFARHRVREIVDGRDKPGHDEVEGTTLIRSWSSYRRKPVSSSRRQARRKLDGSCRRLLVIPAQAGIQYAVRWQSPGHHRQLHGLLDARLRGHDNVDGRDTPGAVCFIPPPCGEVRRRLAASGWGAILGRRETHPTRLRPSGLRRPPRQGEGRKVAGAACHAGQRPV